MRSHHDGKVLSFAQQKRAVIAAGALALLLVLAGSAQALSSPQLPSPESQEIKAALKIDDLNARIKELERIKAAYPQSSMSDAIDRHIFAARVGLCETVDAVAELQDSLLSQGTGFGRLDNFYFACDRVLNHRNIDRFDKARVTSLIEAYVAGYLKAASDPGVIRDIPDAQRKYIGSYTASMFLFEAQALLREGRADKVVETLEKYKKAGGPRDAAFAYYSAEVSAAQGKTTEAYEAYFTAAVENYKDSDAKARALYQKINGTLEGFEAGLEAKWRELPYRAECSIPASGWMGKTILAEIFTGSECPPCVAADLGFDGLIEAFGSRYVAVLEYHLPIPAPDPLYTPAARKRQDFYGVASTPTTFFDGERKFAGGGAKARSEEKFKEYRSEVEARVLRSPQVALQAAAVRRDGFIDVDCSFDKVIPGAACSVALVEKEVRYRGANGIFFHKMVVRDLLALEPTAKETRATFDLADTQSSIARHLDEFEKERAFRLKEKKSAIDPAGLAVVVFVQDKESKEVFNAVYADVK